MCCGRRGGWQSRGRGKEPNHKKRQGEQKGQKEGALSVHLGWQFQVNEAMHKLVAIILIPYA